MARVTVVDCLENVENRFQLVLVAAKRARQLIMGAEPQVEPGYDKPTVLALREIAEGKIGPSILEEAEEETIEDYFGEQDGAHDEYDELDRDLVAQLKAQIADDEGGAGGPGGPGGEFRGRGEHGFAGREQPHAQSHEQSHEQPHEQSHEQSHEQPPSSAPAPGRGD